MSRSVHTFNISCDHIVTFNELYMFEDCAIPPIAVESFGRYFTLTPSKKCIFFQFKYFEV